MIISLGSIELEIAPWALFFTLLGLLAAPLAAYCMRQPVQTFLRKVTGGEKGPSPSPGTGLEALSLNEIQTRPGRNSAIPLEDRVMACHYCEGAKEALVKARGSDYGPPRHGSLETVEGQRFYVPPDFPCEDVLLVNCQAEDGCFLHVPLHVRVTRADALQQLASRVHEAFEVVSTPQGQGSMVYLGQAALIGIPEIALNYVGLKTLLSSIPLLDGAMAFGLFVVVVIAAHLREEEAKKREGTFLLFGSVGLATLIGASGAYWAARPLQLPLPLLTMAVGSAAALRYFLSHAAAVVGARTLLPIAKPADPPTATSAAPPATALATTPTTATPEAPAPAAADPPLRPPEDIALAENPQQLNVVSALSLIFFGSVVLVIGRLIMSFCRLFEQVLTGTTRVLPLLGRALGTLWRLAWLLVGNVFTLASDLGEQMIHACQPRLRITEPCHGQVVDGKLEVAGTTRLRSSSQIGIYLEISDGKRYRLGATSATDGGFSGSFPLTNLMVLVDQQTRVVLFATAGAIRSNRVQVYLDLQEPRAVPRIRQVAGPTGGQATFASADQAPTAAAEVAAGEAAIPRQEAMMTREGEAAERVRTIREWAMETGWKLEEKDDTKNGADGLRCGEPGIDHQRVPEEVVQFSRR